MRRPHLSLLALGFGLALALALPLPMSAVTVERDPLEGTWRFNGGTIVVVTRVNGSFRATVRAETTFLHCPHREGEQIWRIWGRDGSYSGLHLGFGARPGCALRYWLPASWRLEGDVLELRVARRTDLRPGPCGLRFSTECYTLRRVGSPARAERPSRTRRVATSFVIDLNGRPARGAARLGPTYDSSNAGGRVTIVEGANGAPPRASGSVVLVHQQLDGDDALLALQVTRVTGDAPARAFAVEVKVSESVRSPCKVGSKGRMLADSAGTLTLSLCGVRLVFPRAVTRTAAGAS